MRLAVALERARRIGIGLLQLDAPITKLVERDGAAGDGATHEIARAQHLHFAVEIFEFGLALEADIAFEAIHQSCASRVLSLLFITITSSEAERPARFKGVSPAFRQLVCAVPSPRLPAFAYADRHELRYGHRRTRCREQPQVSPPRPGAASPRRRRAPA